jgi:hypothetical protein
VCLNLTAVRSLNREAVCVTHREFENCLRNKKRCTTTCQSDLFWGGAYYIIRMPKQSGYKLTCRRNY